MSAEYERLSGWAKLIRERTDFVPETALVLGSGLGGFAEHVEIAAEVPYGDLPGFPVSTVAGHAGRFLFGTVNGARVVVMQGRVHYYEGYPIRDVVAPIRLMGLLGAKQLLLTNAAGGVDLSFSPGDLMLLTDHISLFAPNPLLGENPDELGPRFPDMSAVYDPDLRRAVTEAAAEADIPLRQGVYAQCTGPSFESPAEIRMLHALGADAVGMSTVCEAIAARHMGLRVCGVSCITNMAAGILPQALSHEEVQQTADRVRDRFEKLISLTLSKI